MKHTTHKLLALLLVLAMLTSVFAVAEDGAQAIVGAEGPIELGGEAVDDVQDPMDGLEIATDAGDGITDGVLELEDGPDLDMNIDLGADLELDLDLEGETLETLEGELAPVTEVAMNDGEPDGTEQNPYPVTNWGTFAQDLAFGEKKRANESKEFPPHFQMNTTVTAPTFGAPLESW